MTLVDENAFGILIAHYGIEDEEYAHEREAFVERFSEVADRWCDARKPLCHVCVLVSECTYGKKAFQDWKTQQVRLEAQRVKDEARQALLMKKEEARRAREDARAAKLAAVEAIVRIEAFKDLTAFEQFDFS